MPLVKVVIIKLVEIDKFKETIINAVRKRKAELDAGINNPEVDKAKQEAIKLNQ